MPVLVADSERYELRLGRNVLGGRGPDAVELTSLAALAPAAVITIRPDGTALIQRISAAVIVKVDGGPLGAMPHPLSHGARLALGPVRLMYGADATPERAEQTARPRETPSDTSRAPTAVVAAMSVPVVGGRLIELGTGCVYQVPRDGLVIGRGADCDITVDGTDVSRRHAFVKPGRGGFTVTDESANGTFVNGARMTGPQTLKHGDVLGIGTEEYRVDIDASPLAAAFERNAGEIELFAGAAEPDPLGLAEPRRRPARPPAAPPPASAAPTMTPAFPSTPALAVLEVGRGPLSGKVFRIERPVCALGRGEHTDIRLTDNSVSTSHATLLLKRGTWYVVDLQSANGTYVDGYRVATERALPDGGTLRLGDIVMKFRVMSSPRELPSATHGGGGIWRRLVKMWSRV
ncbi:MAG: FHA domain-containing protein [Gemmatimonadaceae bacterium]